MIDLRRLQAFVAVAEEGHITRAAERLGMQQPPLTRLLHRLEAELGVLLLRRLPRGVQPTEAGEALLAEARAVLARAEQVEDTVRRAARGEQGDLAVGFTSSAALHPIVPIALRAFREEVPNVRLTLDEAGTAELVDAVLHERLDAAFIRSPAAATPGVLVDPVAEEPMVAALPAGSSRVEGRGPIGLGALASEAFVLYRRHTGPGLYDAILAACHAAGFSPRVVQDAPRLTATLSLVAAGLGVSLVPASMRRLTVAGVVYRDLERDGAPVAPLHLVMRRTRHSATAARFRTTVRRLREAEG